MANKRKEKHGISPRATAILIACVLVGIFGYTRYHDISERRARLEAEKQQLEAQLEELKEKRDHLETQSLRGTDKAFIESVARSQLDMVYPGEIIFRTTTE